MIDSYSMFWRFYLQEHQRPRTRRVHIDGTATAAALMIAAIVLPDPWPVLATALVGYAPAWIAHALIEKNRPATWCFPPWSPASDIRMTAAWFTGSLARELQQAGIDLDTSSG